MPQVLYRELSIDEASLLGTIDRSERIEAYYVVVAGALELCESGEEVARWGDAQLAEYVARLRQLIESGGLVSSAWDGEQLVGIASLDVTGVGGDSAVMKLDMLYVHAGYRGRGVGRTLTELAARRARALGATSLYVSATPTRGTVDAYLRMGATVLAVPDPALFALEPEDVHLEIRLG